MSDNTKLDMAAFDSDVMFGRSRLLRGLGAALFGSAISAFAPASADACSGGGEEEGCRTGPCTHKLPWMNECSNCKNGGCPNCTPIDTYCKYPGSGVSMWCTCYEKKLWFCYDWDQAGDDCYCTFNSGAPC